MKVKDLKLNIGDKVVVNDNPNSPFFMEEYECRKGAFGTVLHGKYGYITPDCTWEVLEYKPAMDLTKIEKPFGLLDKETQEALKNHRGEIEYYTVADWRDIKNPAFVVTATYRAKPQPEVKEMTVEQISKELGYEVKIVK